MLVMEVNVTYYDDLVADELEMDYKLLGFFLDGYGVYQSVRTAIRFQESTVSNLYYRCYSPIYITSQQSNLIKSLSNVFVEYVFVECFSY